MQNAHKIDKAEMIEHWFTVTLIIIVGGLFIVIFWYLMIMSEMLKDIDDNLIALTDANEKMITTLMGALFKLRRTSECKHDKY